MVGTTHARSLDALLREAADLRDELCDLENDLADSPNPGRDSIDGDDYKSELRYIIDQKESELDELEAEIERLEK